MLVLTLFFVLYASRFSSSISRDRSGSRPIPFTICGVDRLEDDTVQEGLGFIETYPWLGVLINPIDGFAPNMTAVILISDEIALSTALDIDSYPKEDFRARSRVVLGNSCEGPYIRVKDYAFHHDYTRGTFSTLALLQLETRSIGLQVFPICPPPEHFSNVDEIYAITVANVTDCYTSSMVVVYKMDHVESTVCHAFYTRIELDIESMWPTHWVCARSLTSELHCIWRSGTALVIRHDDKWKLLGVGISGPGCQTPSRFLDYGMYQPWVKRVIAGIGQPTISRIASNHLILRRTTNNIPRYGRCDPEESQVEMYSDTITVVPSIEDVNEKEFVSDYFNVTLLEYVDYQCIVLLVWNSMGTSDTPTIHKIRRWCSGRDCFNPGRGSFNLNKGNVNPSRGNVNYYVEIKFRDMCSFKIAAYGVEVV